MAHVVHNIAVIGGSTQARKDLVIVGMQPGIANIAGIGAGAAVVTTVTFAKELPTTYCVQVTPNQDATAFVSNRTSTGFDVTLTPRLAATTLGIGTFDVIVWG